MTVGRKLSEFRADLWVLGGALITSALFVITLLFWNASRNVRAIKSLESRVAERTAELEVARGGSGNLNRVDKWTFRATAA
jgi:hypothetical protein